MNAILVVHDLGPEHNFGHWGPSSWSQGCIKAGFFIKSPAGRLKLVKTGFYWSKLAEIFSKQISQNGTNKFNYCNKEHNVKQHNH